MNHRKHVVWHSGELFSVAIEDLDRRTADEIARELRADFFKARVIRRMERRCYAIAIRDDRERAPRPCDL